MNELSGDYTGCPALIYDTEGNHLGNTIITQYEKSALRIELREMPSTLNQGAACKILIMASPSPCEYQGRIIKEGQRFQIAMFFGKVKENRITARYKTNASATIENLIYDGRAYPLFSPLKVNILNISKSGVRLVGSKNTFMDGDRFQMRMNINGSDKLLIADVVNCVDREGDVSEYGCQFLIGSERVG